MIVKVLMQFSVVHLASLQSVINANCSLYIFVMNRLTDTVYNKIRSIREARKSDVFVSRTPCNIRIKEGSEKSIKISIDKKIVQKNVGIPIECEVCGNQLGYKKDDDFIFMNLIEEDGVCYNVCSS